MQWATNEGPDQPVHLHSHRTPFYIHRYNQLFCNQAPKSLIIRRKCVGWTRPSFTAHTERKIPEVFMFSEPDKQNLSNQATSVTRK